MAAEKGIPERREIFLETCFSVFCKNGLESTSLQMLADACGVTKGTLIYYFSTKDNIVTESTAYCMTKVEDDYVSRAPVDFNDMERFFREMPYIAAELHSDKYRTMYQVYTSPRYKEQGKAYLEGVKVRYREYAERFSYRLGLPADLVESIIYLFVHACIHYALFGYEEYLKLQIDMIRTLLNVY